MFSIDSNFLRLTIVSAIKAKKTNKEKARIARKITRVITARAAEMWQV